MQAIRPIRPTHRASLVAALASALLLLTVTSTACRDRSNILREYRHVRDFTLVERSGQTVSRADLDGRIWVANFFFAGCSVECASVLQRMAQIQDRTRSLTNVMLVSFTTDPRSDTPAALRTYAAQFHADPQRWLFLTGDRQELLGTIVHSFLMPIATDHREQANLLSGIVHSDLLAIVDPRGVVRAYFDGLDPHCADQVLDAISKLTQYASPTQQPK